MSAIEKFKSDATKGICSACGKSMPPLTSSSIEEQIEEYGDDANTSCGQCTVECLVGSGWDMEDFKSYIPDLVELAATLLAQQAEGEKAIAFLAQRDSAIRFTNPLMVARRRKRIAKPTSTNNG